MKLKRLLKGSERGADVKMVQRALNAAPARTRIAVTSVYDETTQRRVTRFRVANSLNPGKQFDQEALDALWPYFDAYGRWRYRLYQPPRLPELGPITPGGSSLLLKSLTHATDGISYFPAFDDAFHEGALIVAPEDIVIDTRVTSANPGSAFYATGESKLRYWVGHLDTQWTLGTKIKRGKPVGRVAPNSIGGGPHCHWAVNAEAYLGKGQQLLYGRTGHGPDYTYGSPSIGLQLRSLI